MSASAAQTAAALDAYTLRVAARPSRVLAELRELQALTSTADGAQRVAWGPGWRDARAWFAQKLSALGLLLNSDAAGNNWVTLPGLSPRSVIVGSHLDSVPNGGWLDGPLGLLAGLEVLRQYAHTTPPATLRLVDWADEEGRFGYSLLGSSAAAGTFDAAAARGLSDREGVRLVDALAAHGVDLERIDGARASLDAMNGRAYLELHIEQGPVLSSIGRSVGVVTGTFGVERHRLRFTGQSAHAGSTPIERRRDPFLAAAETALECRAIAARHSSPTAGVVSTVGMVAVQPNIATAVPGVCEISLDQRALDPAVLASMLAEAREASERSARANGVHVRWTASWRIEPRLFDPDLVALCADAVLEETGDAPRLPSGPLHDAAQMALRMPAVMMFVCSPNGLSHCKEEDTPERDLEAAIRAFVRLVERTVEYVTREI
jgi:allantoate deiminase